MTKSKQLNTLNRNPAVLKLMEQLQQHVGVSFDNVQLLITAFTHSSYVNEHRKMKYEDNERLEFLGDAVLELGVSQYLYDHHPHKSEGELTKLRASIVCEPSLVQFTKELKLEPYILLGKGEELTGGRTRPALLADVLESFVGALFLDQGMPAVQQILQRVVFPKIENDAFSHVMDYKSQLQEIVQHHDYGQLHYQIIEEIGPAHAKEFVTEVAINQKVVGKGTGRSKKEAEQEAARQAIASIQK